MIKKFENFTTKKDFIFNKINNAKVGDILPEDIIYTYVQYLHGTHDFIDGDLGDRIEKYSKYCLTEVNIEDLNIDEYYLFDDLKDEYLARYNKSGYYPPIVITHDNILIDGNHRANALYEKGLIKIKAFKGLNSYKR